MSRSDAIAHQVNAVAQDLAALIDLLHGDASDPSRPVADVIAAVEAVGRLMDCARVRAVVPLVKNPMLVEHLGYGSPTAAVASLAQISERSARTRLTVAGSVGENRTLTGAVLPAERRGVGCGLDRP